jgi:hypothetical protein
VRSRDEHGPCESRVIAADSEPLGEDGAARGPTRCGHFDQFPLGSQSEQERRKRRIEARRAQADLLLAATSQDAFTTQIRLAFRDLDEAATWLNATGSLGSESTLGMVDALLSLSGCRLDLVRALLRTFGADAVPNDGNSRIRR